MRGGIRVGHHAGYLATGFLIYFLIYFGVLIYEEGTLVRGFDGSVQSFAWLSKLARDWHALQPPLWDFTSFSGTSFIGEMQTGVLYPGNILLGWFAPVISQHSMDVYVFVHYVLAFYFMALLLRQCRFTLASTLAGAFAFASYLDWVQPHRFVGMVYLPLVLLFFLFGLKHRKKIVLNTWFYLCGIALGLMILAGHIQPYLHSTIALCIFAAVLEWAPTYSRQRLFVLLKCLTFVGLISALFSAPQWLLSLEHFSKSYRWAPDRTAGLERVSYEVYGFADAMAPELLDYLLQSWIPVALAVSLMTICLSRGHNRRFAVFGVVLVTFATLSALGDRGYVSRLTYHIPILNSAREATRYVFLILFGSSMLLAVTVESLIRGLSWFLARFKWRESGPLSNLGTTSPSPWVQAVVIVALAVPLWSHSSVFLRIQGNEDPLSPVQLYFRGKIVRYLAQQQEKLATFRVFNFKQCMARNLGNAFSMLTIRGHRATILSSYFDYFSGTLDNPQDPGLDVLGVRYVISPEPLNGLKLIMHEENLYLYERETALPIFHWYDPVSGVRRPAELTSVDFNANSVQLTLEEPAKGMLLFSQPFFPGWQVQVGENLRELQQVGIFMAVALEANETTLSFRYRPWLIWLGLASMVISVSACAATAVVRKRSSRQDNQIE